MCVLAHRWITVKTLSHVTSRNEFYSTQTISWLKENILATIMGRDESNISPAPASDGNQEPVSKSFELSKVISSFY